MSCDESTRADMSLTGEGLELAVPTAQAMHLLGRALSGVLQPGDAIIASGPLGAGKTALAQGLAAGLGVTEVVTSPTFVLCREYGLEAPSATRRGLCRFVHVDAYRLSSAAEVDDLDLMFSLGDAVGYIEWGEGLVEYLFTHYLHILIERSNNPYDESRYVTLIPVGQRWNLDELSALVTTVKEKISRLEPEDGGDASEDREEGV